MSMAGGGTPMRQRQRHRQSGGSGIGFGGAGGGSFDLEDGGPGGYLDDDEDKVIGMDMPAERVDPWSVLF